MRRGKFLTSLTATPENTFDGGRRNWRITKALRYWSDRFQRTFNVPKNFLTDFASVPRLPLVWWVMSDRGHAAAVLHDYLCRLFVVPRRDADLIFFDALLCEGVPRWRAWLMYAAVRLAGRAKDGDYDGDGNNNGRAPVA